jgi:AraC-like DNA-binding protein
MGVQWIDVLRCQPMDNHRQPSFTARVRDLLTARGPLPMPDVARALLVSERSLHRRLADEGTSFSTVLDQTRLELAELLIKRELTSCQIATRLGFANTRSFHRAYRRWTEIRYVMRVTEEKEPIRVGVLGARGRMGVEVCKAVDAADDLDLVAMIDQGDWLFNASDAAAQVVVDFTTPDVVMDNLHWCIDQGISVVVAPAGSPRRVSSGCARGSRAILRWVW